MTLWPPFSQLSALLYLPPLKERAPEPGTRSARLVQAGHAKVKEEVAWGVEDMHADQRRSLGNPVYFLEL